jgi:hypothetical protein
LTISKRHQEIWDKCRDLILPFDGAPCQVSVLGLPKKYFLDALNIFGDAAPWSGFPDFVDDGTTTGGYPVDNTLTARMKTHPITCSGTHVSGRALSAMPLLNNDGTIDFELVFWGDVWFHSPSEDEANCHSFSMLLKILDEIRALDGSTECACAMGGSRDPRLDRNTKRSIFW